MKYMERKIFEKENLGHIYIWGWEREKEVRRTKHLVREKNQESLGRWKPKEKCFRKEISSRIRGCQEIVTWVKKNLNLEIRTCLKELCPQVWEEVRLEGHNGRAREGQTRKSRQETQETWGVKYLRTEDQWNLRFLQDLGNVSGWKSPRKWAKEISSETRVNRRENLRWGEAEERLCGRVGGNIACWEEDHLVTWREKFGAVTVESKEKHSKQEIGKWYFEDSPWKVVFPST